jgi:hypothetical protein
MASDPAALAEQASVAAHVFARASKLNSVPCVEYDARQGALVLEWGSMWPTPETRRLATWQYDLADAEAFWFHVYDIVAQMPFREDAPSLAWAGLGVVGSLDDQDGTYDFPVTLATLRALTSEPRAPCGASCERVPLIVVSVVRQPSCALAHWLSAESPTRDSCRAVIRGSTFKTLETIRRVASVYRRLWEAAKCDEANILLTREPLD